MATVAMPFDTFSAQYHETMAATSTVGSAIRSGASYVSIAKDFWSLQRKFRSFVIFLYKLEKAPPKDLKKLLGDLRELHHNGVELVEMASTRKLANRTLINGSIQSLRKCHEDLFDYIEHLGMSLDESLVACCEESAREFRRGETVSLDSLLR